MNPRLRLSAFAIVALAALSACSSDALAPTPGSQEPGGPVSPPSPSPGGANPSFVGPAADAPTIANPVVTFYAKQGEDREGLMYYHARPGHQDSTVFVRLRVRAQSLDRLPNGDPIAPGDSVLITITLLDSTTLAVDCQPSGLRFSLDHPADIKMSFAEGDTDGDDAGASTSSSTTPSTLAIWRRETPTDPWMALPTMVDSGSHEVEADITGFTSYAIAF